MEAAMKVYGPMRHPAPGAALTRSVGPAAAPSVASFFGDES
jgi:hypothetical protein